MDVLVAVALVTGCGAIAEDIWRGRISNWTSGGAVLSGVCCHSAQLGLAGLGGSLLGALTGFGLFFVFYLAGGMGGGDVKLMAGFGSILGSSAVSKAAFLAAVLGAILAAVVWMVRTGFGRRPLRVLTIPYAPAISIGAWLALLTA
ncbi:MAG: A24 family peptidase [Acidobacteriota bacterium]|nr:A24 family peptidase [Acidobacteriota bacterium]